MDTTNLALQNQPIDALTIVSGLDVATVAATMQKINKFQSVIQTSLQKERDYGVIPGTQKPTLLKSGAEKINMLFGLNPEYEFMTAVSDFEKGFFNYEIRCTLMRNGCPVAQGVGSCNSYEKKYRYSTMTEDQLEENGIDPNTGTMFTDRYGRTRYRVEAPDPADKANTILKMAKKRAYVDATLQVASLSDLFTQDLEDMADQFKAEAESTMTIAEAASIKLNFGKHKGRMLGELYKDKAAGGRDYIAWLIENDRTDPTIKKAATMLIDAHRDSMAAKATTTTSIRPDTNTAEVAITGIMAELADDAEVPFN